MAKAKKTGIEQAVEFAKGIRPLARLVGIGKSSVFRMYENGIVPPKRCLHFHKITGIPLHDLNPDVYPPEKRATSKQAKAA